VSGHASQEEQKLLLHLLQPRYLVPIHGELRHLHAHARLAYETGLPQENVFVIENGYVLEFTSHKATVTERVPGGYVFVDGSGIGDVGPTLMREREQLASDGFVVVVIPYNEDGQLAVPPRIVTRGFVFHRQVSELLTGASERVQQVLARQDMIVQEEIEDTLRQELEDYFYSETKRRPIVAALLSPAYFS
jgi:ribonuclease J